MDSIATLTYFLLVSLSIVQLSESCMCLPTHPQNAFCKANFAMKVEVVSERQYKYVDNYEMFVKMGLPAPRLAYYKVNVIKLFRGENEIKDLLKPSDEELYTTEIYTNDNGAACGVNFENGQKYLVTGRLVNGRIQVSQCDWMSEWHHVTHQMKKGLHGNFDCRCFIATCIDGFCDRSSDCKLEASWDQPLDECSIKFRTCRSTNQNCDWSTSLEYNVCSGKHVIP